MKNTFITILLLFTFSSITNAQKNLIENVTWEFTNQKMIIYFDLKSPDDITDRRYNLGIEVILDNGSFKPSTGLSGHISQLAGKKRKIVWYYTAGGRTQRELDIPETKVEVFITKTTPEIKNGKVPDPPRGDQNNQRTITTNLPQPSLALPAIVTAAGTGAVIYGLILEKKGKDLYDQYKLDTSSTRNDIYDEANKKHVPAQYLTYGGAILTGAGIYLITRTLKKRKSAKNKLGIIPATGDGTYWGSNIGMGIEYRF